MTQKISKDRLCQILEAENYTLVELWVEKLPSTSLSRLSYVCPKGHEGKAFLCNWRKGKRCQRCHTLDNKRIQDTDLRELVNKDNYLFIDSFVKRQQTYFRYTCPRGHNSQSSLSCWGKGKRCKKCDIENKRSDVSFVKSFFESEGYECLSVYIKKSTTWVDFVCSNKHAGSVKMSRCKAEGIRCFQCLNAGGFKDNQPGTLYYLAISHNAKKYYKIGITNKTVEKRFREKDRQIIRILSEKVFLFGWMAREEERKILQKYRKYKYKGCDILANGNTEIFTKDILCLDKTS